MSSGKRRCIVGRVAPDVSKYGSAFIFSVKLDKEEGDVFGTVSVLFSFVRDEIAEPPCCHVNLGKQTISSTRTNFSKRFRHNKRF